MVWEYQFIEERVGSKPGSVIYVKNLHDGGYLSGTLVTKRL